MTKLAELHLKIQEVIELHKILPISKLLKDIYNPYNNKEVRRKIVVWKDTYFQDIYNIKQLLSGWSELGEMSDKQLDIALTWALHTLLNAKNPFLEIPGYIENRIKQYDNYIKAVKVFYEMRDCNE